MNIEQAQRASVTAILAGQTPYLEGPPGVGKTAMAYELPAILGDDFGIIMVRLADLESVDGRGMPHVDVENNRTIWISPEFLPRASEHGERGVLFIDEWPQGAPSVQNAFGQLIRERSIGNYRLPDGWVVVLAGNRATDRAATSMVPSHIRDRVIRLEVEPDQDVFAKWAAENGVRADVVSFIRARPTHLEGFDSKEWKSPTPRGWESVSRVMDQNPDSDIRLAMIAGIVGQGAAGEFLAHFELADYMVPFSSVVADPEGADVPERLDVLYAMTGVMARRIDPENLGQVIRYLGRLPQEMAIITMKDASNRTPAIRETEAFIEWHTRPENVAVHIG